MRFIRDVIAVVRDPLTLGVCALILAAFALLQVDQIREQTNEQRCRDRIDAELVVEMARSLQRLEDTQRAAAVGDEEAMTAILDLPDEVFDAYERAIVRRENAVGICG